MEKSSAMRKGMSITLESFDISLNDFPDEILLIIFQWLNSIDVLYSFRNLDSIELFVIEYFPDISI